MALMFIPSNPAALAGRCVMSKNLTNSIAATCLVAAAVVGVYWYWSPFITIKQLQAAVEAQDADAFNKRVDYPKLRESFKGQYAALMAETLGGSRSSSSGFGSLGTMLGMALVNQMIEAFVRPETIMRAMQDGKFAQESKSDKSSPDPAGGTSAEKRREWTFERKDFDTLVAYVQDPAKPNASSAEQLGLVFLRNGFADWKLSEVRLPLSK